MKGYRVVKRYLDTGEYTGLYNLWPETWDGSVQAGVRHFSRILDRAISVDCGAGVHFFTVRKAAEEAMEILKSKWYTLEMWEIETIGDVVRPIMNKPGAGWNERKARAEGVQYKKLLKCR